ncbi:hypothetical protein FGW20_07740 [Methanoculleus sp. FWC-SCC3]|uniref:Archaeal flagella protein FlaD/E domain-containing protein n=1 Tax=Methanoculleus methanifontis TaxID=2584086 RepID=A0ABT8M379_9EURY|nr:hypothetical protein [Methanoculleus sp. FWC-SCC3]MDN7012931.1 hypothetical protein [Methanoculleus sp. FWC-SCC3]
MVGVDQAQIDKILSGISSDDPETRLDALEKELDFVKTSIKRLLIDLRERMNELDNPFTSATTSHTRNWSEPPALAMDDEERDGEMPALDTPPAGLSVPEVHPAPEGLGTGFFPADLGLPTGSMAALPEANPPAPETKAAGKLKLQKVHRLFAWVHQGCNKYGHEHMTIMTDAYRSMGYITDDVADQIREIMRMAPETRHDVADIGPNEFVSELYVLNRILDPEDATLDRDLIEVLMLSRRGSGEQESRKTSSQEQDAGDTWIELLDRI